MKKLSNRRIALGFALVVVLANPALVARADGDVVSGVKWLGGKIRKGAVAYKNSFKNKKADDKTDATTATADEVAPPPPAPEDQVAPPPPSDTYLWSTDAKSVERSGAGHLTGARERAEVRLESTESRQYTSYDPVDVQVPVYQCASTSGNGSSNNWNGYFNAPRAQKAKALADTIKGVGQATGEKLVADNAFDHKPRSWADFSSIIEREDDRIPGLYHNVITQYGADNRVALGYASASTSGDDCTITGYRNRRTYVEQLHTEIVPNSTKYLTFDLDIEGGAILPAEKETFTVSFAGDKGVWVDAPSFYNSYHITSLDGTTRDGYAEKLAQGTRNRVQPPAALTVYAKPNNGRVDLEVTDNNYIDGSQLGDRYAIYTVYQAKGGSDGAITGQMSATMKPGNWTKIETTAAPDMTKGAAILGADRNKVKAYGKLRIKYKNSAYYSEDMSAEVQSSVADFGPKRSR